MSLRAPSHHATARDRLEQGFTLIEVIISVVLLTMIMGSGHRRAHLVDPPVVGHEPAGPRVERRADRCGLSSCATRRRPVGPIRRPARPDNTLGVTVPGDADLRIARNARCRLQVDRLLDHGQLHAHRELLVRRHPARPVQGSATVAHNLRTGQRRRAGVARGRQPAALGTRRHLHRRRQPGRAVPDPARSGEDAGHGEQRAGEHDDSLLVHPHRRRCARRTTRSPTPHRRRRSSSSAGAGCGSGTETHHRSRRGATLQHLRHSARPCIRPDVRQRTPTPPAVPRSTSPTAASTTPTAQRRSSRAVHAAAKCRQLLPGRRSRVLARTRRSVVRPAAPTVAGNPSGCGRAGHLRRDTHGLVRVPAPWRPGTTCSTTACVSHGASLRSSGGCCSISRTGRSTRHRRRRRSTSPVSRPGQYKGLVLWQDKSDTNTMLVRGEHRQ